MYFQLYARNTLLKTLEQGQVVMQRGKLLNNDINKKNNGKELKRKKRKPRSKYTETGTTNAKLVCGNQVRKSGVRQGQEAKLNRMQMLFQNKTGSKASQRAGHAYYWYTTLQPMAKVMESTYLGDVHSALSLNKK